MNRRLLFTNLLPGVLLGALGLVAIWAGLYVRETTYRPDIDANGDAVIEKIKKEPLPEERARGVITAAIEDGKQGRRLLQSTGAVMTVFGFLAGALALWVVVGGYVAAKKSN